MLLLGRQEGHPACKKTEWWGAGMVICLKLTWVVLDKGPLSWRVWLYWWLECYRVIQLLQCCVSALCEVVKVGRWWWCVMCWLAVERVNADVANLSLHCGTSCQHQVLHYFLSTLFISVLPSSTTASCPVLNIRVTIFFVCINVLRRRNKESINLMVFLVCKRSIVV